MSQHNFAQSVFLLHPSDVAHMIEACYSHDEIVL